MTEEVSRDLPALSNNDSSLGIGLLENSKLVLPICLPVVLGAGLGVLNDCEDVCFQGHHRNVEEEMDIG